MRDIPADKVRYHTCHGINQGPHIHDLHLRDFIEPMLRVNAQAVSFEVMNPRHMHDYHAFEEVRLPEGKIVIPADALEEYRRSVTVSTEGEEDSPPPPRVSLRNIKPCDR